MLSTAAVPPRQLALAALLSPEFPPTAKPYYMNASERGNVARFVNHSHHANTACEVVFVADWEMPVLAFRAACPIVCGAEVTADYTYAAASFATVAPISDRPASVLRSCSFHHCSALCGTHAASLGQQLTLPTRSRAALATSAPPSTSVVRSNRLLLRAHETAFSLLPFKTRRTFSASNDDKRVKCVCSPECPHNIL